MKPLMLIPPAQAEALSDARWDDIPMEDRAPPPWLDDDGSEDAAPFPLSPPGQTSPRPKERPRLRAA